MTSFVFRLFFRSSRFVDGSIAPPTTFQKMVPKRPKCGGGSRPHPLKSTRAWVLRLSRIKYHGWGIMIHTRARRSSRARSPTDTNLNKEPERQFEGWVSVVRTAAIPSRFVRLVTIRRWQYVRIVMYCSKRFCTNWR